MTERGFSNGDLDRLLVDLRTELVKAPDAETERGHVAAMMAAAPPSESQTVITPRPRLVDRLRAFALKVSAGTAGVLAATTGLAYAGVDLPGTAAAAAVEAVLPVELPNQHNSESSRADEVHAVQSAMPERGCEYGQAVADAANGEHGRSSEHDPCAGTPQPEPTGGTEDKTKAPKEPKTPKEPKGPKDDPSDPNKAASRERSGGHSKAGDAPNGPKEPRPVVTERPRPETPKPEKADNPSKDKQAEAEESSGGKSQAGESPKGPQEPGPQETETPQS